MIICREVVAPQAVDVEGRWCWDVYAHDVYRRRCALSVGLPNVEPRPTRDPRQTIIAIDGARATLLVQGTRTCSLAGERAPSGCHAPPVPGRHNGALQALSAIAIASRWVLPMRARSDQTRAPHGAAPAAACTPCCKRMLWPNCYAGGQQSNPQRAGALHAFACATSSSLGCALHPSEGADAGSAALHTAPARSCVTPC